MVQEMIMVKVKYYTLLLRIRHKVLNKSAANPTIIYWPYLARPCADLTAHVNVGIDYMWL